MVIRSKIYLLMMSLVFQFCSLFGWGNTSSFPYIKVQSSYRDIETGKLEDSTVATGVLVQVSSLLNLNPRFFVITASHVSQGENLNISVKIENTYKTLRPLTRIADTFFDIEVIEVEYTEDVKPAAILVRTNKGRQILASEFVELLGPKLYHKYSDSYIEPFKVGPRFDETQKKLMPLAPFIVVPIQPYCHAEEDTGDRVVSGEKQDPLLESIYGGAIITGGIALIAPGMSGAPLFKTETIDGLDIQILKGIATQYERGGTRSHFTSASHAIDLLNKLINRTHFGLVDKVYWRSRRGLLFREFCSGPKGCNQTFEISPISTVTGGGVHGDGGNKSDPPTCDFNDYNIENKFGIEAGMEFEGRNIIGFKLTTKEGGEPFYVDANLASLDFINQQRERLIVETVEGTDPLIPILLNRYQEKFGQSTHNFKFGIPGIPEIQMTINKNSIDIQILGPQLSYEIFEPIHFSLDNYGRLISEVTTFRKLKLIHQAFGDRSGINKFRPVIEVFGEEGLSAYLIDIRELFFVDLYHVKKTSSPIDHIKTKYFKGGLISVRPKHSLNSRLMIPFIKRLD